MGWVKPRIIAGGGDGVGVIGWSGGIVGIVPVVKIFFEGDRYATTTIYPP